MTFASLVKKSLPVLFYANAAAAALAGIWLIYAGHLAGVWPLFLAFIFSPVVLPLLLLPTGFFAGILRLLSNGGGPKLIIKVLSFLSIGWIVVVMAGYALLCFHVLADTLATMPLQAMVYACAVALAPFCMLAAKERDNLLFTSLVWYMQIAAVVTTLAYVPLGWDWDSWNNFWLFAAIIGVLVLLQAAYEELFMTKKNIASVPDAPGAPPAP